MNKSQFFDFIYIAVPDEDCVFYSVCCYDENGTKIKEIDKVGEKEVTENFCEFLNNGKVHPCHFEEVFDDYFG